MLASTRQLFATILFAAIFIMAAREISDPDFWWHLRTGQYIVETGSIPHSDIFSFTAPGKEWVTHEWLSEVIIYSLFRAGGFTLLIVTFAGIITAAFALVYLLCKGRPFLAGFVVLLGALATAPTWGVRPQMFSFLLTAVFLLFLEGYRQSGKWRHIAPLAPLMILWVNLHSGFALGLVLAGIYLFAMLVESSARKNILPVRGRLLGLLAVFILMLVGVILNPNGARMYTYPIETLTSPAMQKYIQEWFSPDLHLIEFQPFGLLILALIGSALWSRARIDLTAVLLTLLFGYAALRSARNIPIFALVAIPVLTHEMAFGFRARGWFRKARPAQTLSRPLGCLNSALILLVLGIAAIRVVSVGANQAAVERANFPAAAVSLIQNQKPPPNLYNSYGWGGYLIWRLYPEYQVYIDGRADVYGDTFIEDYLRIYRAEPGWNEQLDRRGVRLALVEPNSPIALALSTSSSWRRVFADSLSAVFERN